MCACVCAHVRARTALNLLFSYSSLCLIMYDVLTLANICGTVSMITSLLSQARFSYYRLLPVEENWVSPIKGRSFSWLPRLLLFRLSSVWFVSNCEIYEVTGPSVAPCSKRGTRPRSRASHFLFSPASLTPFMIANAC